MPARISKWFFDYFWRLWYPLVTRFTRDAPVIFLNYGYAGDKTQGNPPELTEQDEPDRVCIQLYDRVARTIDLHGLCVLEVSCGHGGGASYVARYLKPKSLRGVDRNARAIGLCKMRHRADGLTFSRGNALALDFAADTFDAVINIEASHCYPDVPRFLREVCRVLRPGGHFLYADFRSEGRDRALLDRQLKQSGMNVVGCEDISRNVVQGMLLNSEKYLKLVKSLAPRLLRTTAMRFAGIEGSLIYNELVSGATVYLLYHLQKPRSRP